MASRANPVRTPPAAEDVALLLAAARRNSAARVGLRAFLIAEADRERQQRR